MHNVKTKEFEGPLDLLLELIEKQKLDITRLSLVEVADDFLEKINQENQIDLANLSDFLLIASQLILLKSRALLPLFEFTPEEEEEMDDLEERLKEYALFKEATETMARNYSSSQEAFGRQEEEIVFSGFVDPQIKAEQLKEIFEKQLISLPTEENLKEEVLEEVISLEEKIGQLRDSMEKRMKMAFAEMIAEAKDKVDVVVTFLAMLEMIKQKMVSAKQTELFGEITIEKRKKHKQAVNASL